MASPSNIFSSDFVTTPYWWEGGPAATAATKLPDKAEVVVIGGGIAGLSTAIELGRGGIRALVLDREAIGWGASSRNGGALSSAGSVGHAKSGLQQAIDPILLAEMAEEAETSFDEFEALVVREGIDCSYRRCGRFVGAHVPKALDMLKRHADMVNASGRDTAEILPPGRVREELSTDRYHGGLVIQRSGCLHPALYTQGLARAAVRHGAILAGGIEVQGWARKEGTILMRTSHGPIEVRGVMVATNGYTGSATPWHRRRLIPIASYMIATETLGPARVRQLMPKLRVYSDTKRIVYYFRPSPDQTRILFGSRASLVDDDVRRAGAKLHRCLVHLLPDLADARISHAWKGHFASTFDMRPHVGVQNDVHFALGCNGGGIVAMTHLGRCAARQILGSGNRSSAFGRVPFPTMPLYGGNPWFMPAVGNWYRLRDFLDGWRVTGPRG